MMTSTHLSQDDLALYALQLLPDEEREAATEHLRHCDVCRSEVGAFQGDLALYSLVSEVHTPPALTRERLLRRVSKEKRVVPVEIPVAASQPPHPEPMLAGRRGGVLEMESRYAAPRRGSSIAAWAGWALAAGLAGAAVFQYHDRQALQNSLTAERAKLTSVQESAMSSQVAVSALTDPAALNVTLRKPTDRGAEAPPAPEGHAAYLPDRGALVFVASNLEPLKPYKVYELWLLPSEEDLPPIPAASFRPDAAGNANVILPTGPKFVSVKGFGVTLEDDNSAPKQPSMPILLMGSSRS